MAEASFEFLTLVELDVTRTLGEKYRHFVRDAAGNVKKLAISDPSQKVVEVVQQHIHDSFIDTVWPACPRHPNHPLWYEAGVWCCERDQVHIAPLGGLRAGAVPEFPIRVTFHEDGEEWVLDSFDELASSLEWFDSDDPTENASVVDGKGRPVRVKVEALELLRFELVQP